jgi:uncharacterized protein (TIRG00374 family)
MDYKYQKIILFILSITLAVGILGVMLTPIWDDLLLAAEQIQYRFLIPAIGFCLLAWLTRGYRYQKILHSLSVPAGLIFSTACIFLSQTINLVGPARLGDFVRVIPIYHEYQATVSQGLSSIVIERLFDIITIGFLGLVAIMFFADVPDWFSTLIVISLIVSGLGVLFILTSTRFTSKNRYISFVLNMLDEIKVASLSRSALSMLLATSTIIWFWDIMVCYFVALMFNVAISFNVVLLAIVIGNLAKAIPITPGGIGTYELAMTAIFEFGKVPATAATLVSVVDHLIKNVITLIGGVVSIFYFGTWIIPRITEVIQQKIFNKI